MLQLLPQGLLVQVSTLNLLRRCVMPLRCVSFAPNTGPIRILLEHVEVSNSLPLHLHHQIVTVDTRQRVKQLVVQIFAHVQQAINCTPTGRTVMDGKQIRLVRAVYRAVSALKQ